MKDLIGIFAILGMIFIASVLCIVGTVLGVVFEMPIGALLWSIGLLLLAVTFIVVVIGGAVISVINELKKGC